MPINNDFESQQIEFTKNLGALNNALGTAHTTIEKEVSKQTNLIKKSGTLNIKAMASHTREIHAATKKLKNGTIQKEMGLESGKLDKTVKSLSDATSKLGKSSESFQTSAKQLAVSNQELSSSMDDVVDVTNKNMEQVKYLGDHMKKFGKWAAIAGVAGAGYLGYRALKGTAKVGARTATAPIRAGMGLGRTVMGARGEAAADVLGDVKTDLATSYRKALGTSIAAFTGGLVPGMFLSGLTRREGGGGGRDGGPGILSRMAGGAGGIARKGIGGLQFGVGKLTEFIAGFPRETREKGIFQMKAAEGEEISVSPSEEFKAGLGAVADKVEETKEIIAEPDEEMQTKVMTKSLSAAFEESGKTGLLKRMFSGVFRLGTTIAYALPIFGAAYKAELPQVRKYGMFGAMLQTLGLIYIHSRFASEESNKLALQQARLLQLGFDISGTLWRPRPRSLSALLGTSIGSMVFGNLFGMEGKGAGLLGKLPGVGGLIASKESEELKSSPSLARRIMLLTNIQNILAEMRDIMIEKGGSAMASPISLQKAATHPHVVTKTGNAKLHEGETVGGGGGGFFSRIFGGIGSLFGGFGIFKKIKAWFADLFKPLTSKLDHLLNWFKATFSFLEPAVQAMNEIQTAFGVGKGTKVTELAEGGGVMLQARAKKSIFGGIFNAIRELPMIVEKSLTNIATNLKTIFEQELGEKRGIGAIIIKSYQTLVPKMFKEAGGQIFESVKRIMTAALQAVVDVSTTSSNLLKILGDYGSKVVQPFQEAWKEGESPFTKFLKVLGAIPASTWEAIKGLIPLGKGLVSSIGDLLSATTVLEKFQRSIGQALVIDIPTIFAEVRKKLVDQIFPQSWSMIFSEITDRILEWSTLAFRSFYDAFDAMDEAAKSFTEARIKRKGIAGVVTGIFQYMFTIIKAAFDPLGEALVNTLATIWLGWEGFKQYSLRQLIKDIVTLGKNTWNLAKKVSDATKEFAEFTFKKPVKLARGGLIYAAEGVVVGEAGPEAVLPLDDPRATAKISGMFANAIKMVKGGPAGHFETLVINRLDSIIGLLGGSPGGERKKAKVIKEKVGVFRKLLGGITDIGVILAKLPFQIGSDVARGIASGLQKGIGILADIGHTMLTAMRTGFTALKHTINLGFTTLKASLSTMWMAITAPFKAFGRFIMRPFKAIKEKYLGIKEKVKEKVKGVIKWLKPGGKKAPIGTDPEGKFVYAKWPAQLVLYTKGIYRILARKFGILGGIGERIRGVGGAAWSTVSTAIGTKLGASGLGAGLGGKLAAAAGPAALVAGLAWAGIHAYKGVRRAGKWHGVEPGAKVTAAQRVTAGIGGFLGGTGENIAGRTVVGAAKGAAIGAGIGSIVPVVGTALGAAVGALAGGVLGAIGGKNIAKGLQFVWKGVKKLAIAIWKLITWPFQLMLGIAKKMRNWFGEKIGSIPILGKWYKETELGKTAEPEKFARGALVTRPTLGVVGERGPEAIIPLSKAPAFARLIQETMMTSPGAIAEHTTMMEMARQKVGADRILEGNKQLQDVLKAQRPSMNNVITNQTTTSNSVSNALSTTGPQQQLDEETEKILGGRLS